MKKLLVVIDYQNDFVSGSLGFDQAKEIEDYLVELITKYHDHYDDVIFTYDTHYDDYLNTEWGKIYQLFIVLKIAKDGSYMERSMHWLVMIKKLKRILLVLWNLEII